MPESIKILSKNKSLLHKKMHHFNLRNGAFAFNKKQSIRLIAFALHIY